MLLARWVFIATKINRIIIIIIGVTFNFDKQDVIDFAKFSKIRSKFIKVVIDPLFFGQKNYKGLLFISKLKEI